MQQQSKFVPKLLVTTALGTALYKTWPLVAYSGVIRPPIPI
jgi:hypothetical protein